MDAKNVQSVSERFETSAKQSDPSSNTHLLHIYHEGGIFSRDLKILDSDKSTPIYAVSRDPPTFTSRGKQAVYRPQNPSQPVGTAVFSGLNGHNVDLQLHGNPVPFERPPGILLVRCEYTWLSGIGPLKWCSASALRRDLVCVNEREEWVAKYEVSYGTKKRGRLEIVNWDIRDGALDEIVVTGLAVAEVMWRRRRN